MKTFVIEPIESEDGARPSEPQGSRALGHAAGVRWYQADTIPSEGREPTPDELAKASIELPSIRQAKESVRRKIQGEMGDLHDIVADQAKQIEALTALVSRMAAEYFGGTQMSVESKFTYLARVESVIAALDSGAQRIRGDMEGADDMLQKMLLRTSRINEIVETEYLPRRAGVLS